MVKRAAFLCAWAASSIACDVPAPPAPTGGVTVDAGACGRGYVVTESDYQSTNVSLVALDGSPLSPSLISSGSAPAGVSAALSGDIALPQTAPTSGRVVVIDRSELGVLTWLAPESGAVLGQLAVGSKMNPHDYLEVDERRAYVTRYGTNPESGAPELERGGDILVIDTRTRTRLSRIDLAPFAEPPFLPRADGMLRFGDDVLVVLQQFDATFRSAASGRILEIATSSDSVVFSVDLPGQKSCGPPVLSPAGTAIAVACTGLFGDEASQIEQSGVVILDAAHPPTERGRYPVARSLGAPIDPSIAFASETLVVGTAAGNLDRVPPRTDQAFALDLTTGAVTRIHEAGTAFVLGDVRCSPRCGGPCVMADAEIGALRRFRLAEDSGAPLVEQDPVRVDSSIGLPPRFLGPF